MTRTDPVSFVTRAVLLRRVWDDPLTMVASEIGLSANGLAKLCDRLGIPRPRRSYWLLPETERARLRPTLPPAPAGVNEEIVLGERPQPRRDRTRLSLDDRRRQLMDEAAGIAVTEGVQEVSMKRLARDVGISEAQAHNCFARRLDLLIALARREIAEVEASRRGVVSRGTNVLTNIVLSTTNYLHEAQARGPLLQALLMVPEVRAELRDERTKMAHEVRQPILESMMTRYGISEARAMGTNAIIAAICLRAGSLISSHKVSLEMAERLCLPIVIAGARSNASAMRNNLD
ncbi:TetR/AcrR family transcriptional regulator [Sphingomonas sp. So64.6b]|uniref:TetR/AcrR family transcriptional regulator n=1 Tax=Sphingomonas sp. So64.6b TaxID=2997354 RepID=UPI0015FEE824|nr:TetR/AcrR family transcriptional regulator [Sphingomonas sp. So64.6b]QNA86326.1 TetR/AcrR family transcriptional regulator [Sphingomonas sp. So64.6b]